MPVSAAMAISAAVTHALVMRSLWTGPGVLYRMASARIKDTLSAAVTAAMKAV